MRWPWSGLKEEVATLKEELAAALDRNIELHERLGKTQSKCDEYRDALQQTAKLHQEATEQLAALKPKHTPGTTFRCPECKSTSCHGVRRILAVDYSPDRPPVETQIGTTVQCLGCGVMWDVEDTITRSIASPKKKQKDEGENQRMMQRDPDLKFRAH